MSKLYKHTVDIREPVFKVHTKILDFLGGPAAEDPDYGNYLAKGQNGEEHIISAEAMKVLIIENKYIYSVWCLEETMPLGIFSFLMKFYLHYRLNLQKNIDKPDFDALYELQKS